MKRAHFVLPAAGAVLAVAMIFLALTGCESTSESDGLTITPSEVTLSATNTATFTVTAGTRDLSLPLEWRVSNPGLGVIVAAEGLNAAYTRSSAQGVNVVTARDQYGAEGFATVRQ